MTCTIKESQLQNREEFEQGVATYIQRMTAFNREVGKPRPVAHPLIEASVKRVQERGKPDKYVPDYVIVPDAPVPCVSLDDKKKRLHAGLVAAENAAKFAILPQLKIRMASIKYSAAMGKPEAERTPEENEDIASYQHVTKAWQEIDLKGAQAESDIDDLTEQNVDNWQVPKLD